MMTGDPIELLVAEPDWERLERLGHRLSILYGGPEHPGLADQLPLIARELPDDLALFLHRFRRDEPAGAAIIRGFGVDDDDLGDTPDRYDPPDPSRASLAWACYLVVIASQLGEPFAWPHLQGGRLVHNVLPAPGDELTKTGTSSASTLELHTEDACHPGRADYLLLHCLRNDDKVPTVYSSLAMAGIDPEAAAVLRQPRYTMMVEPDHIETLGQRRQVPVLYGDPARPYLAYDGFYLEATDSEAAEALEHLTVRLEAAAADVVLEPGDLVIIDNATAAHGRRQFKARYDGRDRWLARVHVRRDRRTARIIA